MILLFLLSKLNKITQTWSFIQCEYALFSIYSIIVFIINGITIYIKEHKT